MISQITINEDVRVGGNVLYARTYIIEHPDDYEPSVITGEDVLLDDAIRVLDADRARCGQPLEVTE